MSCKMFLNDDEAIDIMNKCNNAFASNNASWIILNTCLLYDTYDHHSTQRGIWP